jgi:hypothetical protein
MKCPILGIECKHLIDPVKINFNFESKEWEGINAEHKTRWKEAYPALDLSVESAKMKAWLLANPTKKKKNYEQFIVRWLSVAQQRGGDKQTPKPVERPQPPIVHAEPQKELTEEERQAKIKRVREIMNGIGKGVE